MFLVDKVQLHFDHGQVANLNPGEGMETDYTTVFMAHFCTETDVQSEQNIIILSLQVNVYNGNGTGSLKLLYPANCPLENSDASSQGPGNGKLVGKKTREKTGERVR